MSYLSSVSSYALAGLQAATDRTAIRAGNIANMATPGYVAEEVEQVSTPSGPRVTGARPGDGPAAPQGLFAQVDLPKEIVDMQSAQRAFEATLVTLKTADEMTKTLLDALA